MLSLFFASQAIAQNTEKALPQSIEQRHAYKNGTRSTDGSVSKSYWQNAVSYRIHAEIDPSKRYLHGKATISYTNNSPDTITYMAFQSYHNLYKPGSAKAVYSQLDITQGVEIEEVIYEGKSLNLSRTSNFATYHTVNYFRTTSPLLPGQTVNIEIGWNYTIPFKNFRRSGAISETAMFVGYWYPEMVVYDDIRGWNDQVYDGGTEFYHEFANFDITLEVPDNYLVWASVAPENGAEVYSDSIAARLQRAQQSTEPVQIVSAAEARGGIKTKSPVWKFKANNIADFAFALAKDYCWDAASYSDKFGQYLLHGVYPNSKPYGQALVPAQQKAIGLFHHQWPRYEFPFHNFTIFNGLSGGGMEFPGMANNNIYSGSSATEQQGRNVSDLEINFGLSFHEMSHMYFPFLMGINEPMYTWMEEGWATFSNNFNPYERPSNESHPEYADHTVAPMMVPSYTQSSHHYTNSYSMGSLAYYSLYQMLGNETYTRCLHSFMNSWKHRHPTPYDFFYTFNQLTGQNLDWFWRRWYFDWGYPDIAIRSFNGKQVVLQNIGGRPLAVQLHITLADGSTQQQSISPAVWQHTDTYKLKLRYKQAIVKLQLSTLGGHDTDASNDYWSK